MAALIESDIQRANGGAGVMPFHATMLKRGGVYAIGVETASARVGLIAGPLRAALSTRRPCALISRLSPEQFANLLCRARGADDIAASVKTGRLKLFTAVGDYGVNLFVHGAARYVHELDYFQLEEGSLVVIDQADDLFTPHDHIAVANQAKVYHEWCERNRHTMLLLHLRTSATRPILDGDQAPAQYFAGVARVTSEAEGLRMKIDFWQSPTGYQTGTVMALDPLLRSQSRNSRKMTADDKRSVEMMRQGTSGVHRERVWYLGPHDSALGTCSHLIKWRVASSFDDILRRGGRGKSVNVLMALGKAERFRDFLDQVITLRSVLGKEARIVVWEVGYRLREYLQKQLLFRAGVDSVLSQSEPLTSLPELLRATRISVSANDDEPMVLAGDWLNDVTGSYRSGWLPGTHFVQEAREVLRRSVLLRVPCALAEVHFDGVAGDVSTEGMPPSTRSGDLSTVAHDAHFFFLRGCRERDVVQAVARRIGNGDSYTLRQINFFTGDEAIASRLEHLEREADEVVFANMTGAATSNIVAMPGIARSALTHSHGGAASLAAMAMVFFLWQPATESHAGENPAQQAGTAMTAPARGAMQAYEAGNYAEAGRLGLIELQQDSGNYDLRFKVANSLAWTGQYREAIRQYQALDRSPVADAAAVGLANVHLWNGRPEQADPLFRRVLATDANNADAKQGLMAAERHLRPRTTLRPGWLDDSSNTERPTLSLAHRWRDASLNQVFEVAAAAGRERRAPDIQNLNQRELSFTYEHLGLFLVPKVQVAAQESPTSKLFGSVGVKLAEGAVAVDVGRANWGKLVFDPRALRDGLTANRAGIEVRADSGIGGWQGSLAHYAVSDGNRVQDLNARYTPSWQPFTTGSGLRAFVGVYARKAARHEDRYWSPESGFYTGYLGLAVDRSEADWDLSAELKRSQRLGGEGASGWSGGLGGKRWLNRDWAVRADAYYLETRRDESAYRAKSVMLSLEHLW